MSHLSDTEDRAFLHSVEPGRGKRFAVLFVALFVVVLVISVVAMGFQGRRFGRNAGALTHPFETPTQPLH